MKMLLIGLAVAVSGLALVLALDAGRFACREVDAGGHKVRMLITGQGSPTVVFETGGTAGAGGPLEAWERVQPGVSRFAKTVAYDRAGVGLSERGPLPRDAQQVARELHTALRNARVTPPYILVGHSFGGPLNRVFAGLYPAEIAGMVLLDPTQEEFMDWNAARQTNQVERTDQEWKDIQASFAQAHASRVPAGVPVVVITGMKHHTFPGVDPEKEREEVNIVKPAWLNFHREWVQKIPTGRHIITRNSGHGIPFEEPELVVQTVREMVEAVRNPVKTP